MRSHAGSRCIRVVSVPRIALAAMLLCWGCETKPTVAPSPPEVVVAQPVQKDVPVMMELVGQTRGSQDVEIRARVEGYLEQVAFTEGSFVPKGQLLYTIDRKPLEAALAQAKANLATAKARLDKANNDVTRYRPLVEQQAVSRQELDNAISAQDASKAQLEACQAAVDKATLDLGYATIHSPIDGLVGTTQVKAGNLVGRGESTLLTTVSQIDPIMFRAGISEAAYLDVAKRAAEIRKAHDNQKVPIELVLADGTVHPDKGNLDVVDRAVDPLTGTLMLQFKFPNTNRLLRPGQFGRARFEMDVRKGALLVPQRAVQELQNLYSLAIVGADNKVTFRNVKVGPRVDGGMWVIEEGLKPGESVVIEGLQRVRDGVPVIPKPAPTSTASAEPVAGGK